MVERVWQTNFLMTPQQDNNYSTIKNLLVLNFSAMENRKVAVFRKEHFNAAHRLHNPNWSDERNERVYGKCNNLNYHGHNYELIVQVIGIIDPDTGYVMDMKVLSDIIKYNVLDRFDHKNLNLDTQEFQNLNPSAENIAIVIHDILREKLDSQLQLKIRLYETERNFVEYPV
jgi:6-pyruvoyltetrahydropterin/6-carboxytetrahydropterin synthase